MSRYPVALAAAAVSLGLSLATAAVLAAPATYDQRIIEVEYGDLDLSSTGGAAALYRRLEAAAHDACAEGDSRDARAAARVRECERQAIAGAVARVDRPTLTALHRGRGNGSDG
ncbi:MAG: UrcA family protein [Steroidobacteraceae bacterium]